MKVKFASSCGMALIILLSSANVTFSAQFEFLPGLNISEEFTDNLFLDPVNEQDDFITTAGLSLTGRALWKTGVLTLTYAPSYSWYADHSDQDNWRHAVDLVGRVDLTRYTRIDLLNSYLRTYNPNDQSANIQVSENPLAQPLIPIDRYRRRRTEYYRNVSNIKLTHNFSASDSIYAGARYSILRETEDPAPGTIKNDHDIFEPSAGMAYWFNPSWGIQLDLLYSDRNYEERNDRSQSDARFRINRRFSRHLEGFIAYRHTYLDYNDDALNSDFTLMMPTIGFSYQLEENASITIAAGYYSQNFDNSSIQDEDGPIIDAEIFKGFLFRRGRIDLIARSGYTINDQGVEDLGLNIYYSGQLNMNYSFTQEFSTTVIGSYRNDEYPNELPVRKDNTIYASAGITYQALSWLALNLAYDFTDLTSDIANREYVENRVLLTITLVPTNPIRLN